MSCECAHKPDFFRADDTHAFLKPMATVSHKAHWVLLRRCNTCGQHWQVDAWDKYQSGLAIRIAAPEAWPDFDDVPIRKRALVQARGGVGPEPCQWAGCRNRALVGLAYCVDCAYERAGIRE